MTDHANFEEFPALDGSNTSNNNNDTTISSSNSINTTSNNNITNSWSTNSNQLNSAHPSSGPQAKLSYLLLNNAGNQHIQQAQQKQHLSQNNQHQQVINQFVDSDHNSNAMVSKYNLQPQQPQQQTAPQMNNNITNNNNTLQNNNSSAVQLPPPQQQKRPGLPNPLTSSDRCCNFKIAPEERRHRDFELEQSKILKEIMQKTNTKIEVTTTKDGALNFIIIGKEQSLQPAKNLVLNDFQTSVTLTVSVPKSIHGRLLGPKGLRLATIQDETQTKINIPRKEEDSDVIKITGLKVNAEAAVRSIQKHAREFAGKAVEKVSVERVYLLFITGPFNENLKRWEELGAKVSTSGGILPSSSDRESGHADEVTFTIQGETVAVSQVKEEILQIYEDKKKKCTTVNIEVKKAQHKYILGPGGQNLRHFFAKTGVSAELPQEGESETITLRGERSKLAPALSELYTQAHSETDEFVEVETWLHKYLIGTRKTNNIDFKARGVDAKSLDNKIKLHGPPSEVDDIKEILEKEVDIIRKTIIRKDIRVEARIHGYIIGKAGTTVDQIREESGAFVLVPKNNEPSEFITLEGTIEAVAIAEEKIDAIAKKYEASRNMSIDQQLHGSIIGKGGEKIRSIREKFPQVVFTFPEQGSRNNIITILGPTDAVEACYKYLDEFHKQLQEINHHVQVPIKKDIVKYLPDAQAAIRRIKAEHKVRVDMFIKSASSSTETDSKSSASAKQNAPETNESSTLDTTQDKSVENKKSKTSKAKQQAAAVTSAGGPGAPAANKKQSNGVQASKEASNANSNASESYAVLIGKKEDVDLAKVKLSKLFEELATTTELEVKVSHKLRSYLGPKSKLYRQLLDEFQQKLVISFPKQSQQESNNSKQSNNKSQTAGGDDPKSGMKTNDASNKNSNNSSNNNSQNPNRIETVKIRGPKNLAKKAEKRFETLVAECQEKLARGFTASTSVSTAVIEKFSPSDKVRLNKIRDTHSIKLSIPDKRDTPQLHCVIVGYEKNVQTALQQFNELVEEVGERIDETVEIASQVHPRLIGAQGRAVRKIMEEFKVEVRFARPGEPNPNSVTLSGRPASVTAAKNHMLKLAEQYLSAGFNNNRTQ